MGRRRQHSFSYRKRIYDQMYYNATISTLLQNLP